MKPTYPLPRSQQMAALPLNSYRCTWFALLGLAGLSSFGCANGPARIEPPEIDPVGAGEAAIEQYDTNKDGKVADDELLASPSLSKALKALDDNGDGALTATEITARILFWQESRLGLTPAICTVTYQNKPLVGAKVTFEPEEFLGENFETYEGITNQQGMTNLSLANSERKFPGVAPGLYLIRITSESTQIPANYNTQTTLGTEIAGDSGMAHGGLVLNLK